MPFITFIYKVGKINNKTKTYYGKCCLDYVSDDHEGLDFEVKYMLVDGLNKYLKKQVTKITIGVLSYSSDNWVPTYSSDEEIDVFDFYRNYNGQIYINGKLVIDVN